MDILFINGIPFLTTIFRHLYFATVKAILNVEAKTLLKSLKGEFVHYHKCGFKVQMLMADNQFDCLADHLAELQIQMTPHTKGEQEKFAEHNIRFIKECWQCSFASLPYKKIPSQNGHPSSKHRSILDQLLSEVPRSVRHDGPKATNE